MNVCYLNKKTKLCIGARMFSFFCLIFNWAWKQITAGNSNSLFSKMSQPRKNNWKTKSLGHQNISTFSFQLICLFRFSKLFCFAQKHDFILMMLTESSFISMFELSWWILQFLITWTTKKKFHQKDILHILWPTVPNAIIPYQS
jgi:hypothetical protein